MQFIFLLFFLYFLVNLSARKDRINLILNLQCVENTPFHTLWKYIYQGFIFSVYATNPTEFQVPYVSEDIYICIFAKSRLKGLLCSMEPSIFVCVLFVLFLFV